MRKLRNVVFSLQPPNVNDLENVMAREVQTFESCLKEAGGKFPKATSVYDSSEYSEAHLKDPDKRFLYFYGVGSANLLAKRDYIRSVLNRLGARTSDPGAFAEILPIFDTSDVLEVMFSRYSINFLTTANFFKDRDDNSSLGIHYKGSVFNAVNINPAIEIVNTDSLKNLPKDGLRNFNGNLLQETLDHEDFHSLIEGFLPTYVVNSDRHNLGCAPSVSDLDHNEILANLSVAAYSIQSIVSGKTLTTGHFVPDVSGGINLGEYDIQSNEAKMAIGRHYDFQEWLDRLNSLYQHVDAKIPWRRGDLDLAFVLFQPSKIRHVERLVNRWTKREKGVKRLFSRLFHKIRPL